jgi:uncharacterized protein YcbK (DUF882 family)
LTAGARGSTLDEVLGLVFTVMTAQLGGAGPAAGAPQEQPVQEDAETPATDRPRRRATGYAVPEERLRRRRAPRPSGNLHLHHAFRGETLKVNIYNPDGSYDVEALKAVSRLLRCTRTGTAKDIEPRLLTILSHIYDHFAGKRIEVTSGYRYQRKTTSFHFRGSATDILLPGVRPARLRAFVETLDEGGMGIGLYPRSGFVHVDVRPPPSYRWVDYSPVDPDDPGRRPPRGFKKKARLQS